MVWRTFEKAAPLIIRVALGVMPFFVAFLMVGVSCFSMAYMELGNFANGMMFLVGSCIGDNLFPFYTPISEIAFISGSIWFYLMVFLGVVCCWNLYQAIVEDAYLDVKYKKGTQWLLDAQKKNEEADKTLIIESRSNESGSTSDSDGDYV